MDPADVRALIKTRCPELTDQDIDALNSDDDLPAEIADLIIDALDELETRLDALEGRMSSERLN